MKPNDSTDLPLGMDPYTRPADPMDEEDWVKRLERLQQLGVSENSLLMRGTEWRRGLAADREGLRREAGDTVRQALGLKTGESAALGASSAAAGGGLKGLMSSL